MIYIYRRSSSQSARALVNALGANARRVRHPDRIRWGRDSDHLICWGEAIPGGGGYQVLNGVPIRSKYTDAVTLRAAGVPTIEVSQTRPIAAPRVPVERLFTVIGGTISPLGARALRDNLDAFLALPEEFTEAPSAEWLPRSNSHVGGNDLLHPPNSPDYWVKKENIRREFRVHSFLGQSIRAGVKVPREVDFPNHDWIRSWQAGWRISYDGSTTRQRHRDLAASACRALGLQFGAVDIGELPDGRAIVLEVNRAPGLEGGTIAAYATAILQWTNQD